MQTATLLTDIPSGKSNGKGFILYGKKGDKVRIISVHDQVFIVEGENKDRFPAHKDNLKIIE